MRHARPGAVLQHPHSRRPPSHSHPPSCRIISNKVKNQKHINERFSIVNEVLPAMKLVK